MSAVDDFAAAMVEAGLRCNTSIIPDGAIHRFRAPDDKTGHQDGWYALYLNDGSAAGVFGNWRTGEKILWNEKYRAPKGATAEQKAEQKRQADEAKRKRDLEIERLQNAAAVRAHKLWSRLKPASPDHPYLTAKRIKPHCARAFYSLLVLPVHDVRTGQLSTLQFIGPDGQKTFLKGGRVKGCAIFIAPPGADRSPINIGEGFATCASVAETTGHSAAAALSTSNLTEVAQAFHDTRKRTHFVIAADNDSDSESNPGRRAAYEAARKIKALVAIPHLADSPDAKCDFNDLAVAEGLDAVREQLSQAAPPIPRIDSNSDDLPAVTKQCWDALQVANHPERLFCLCNSPVRTKLNDSGQLITEELNEPRMRYELARAAEWRKDVKRGFFTENLPGKPSRDHVQDVLATPQLKLPILHRITEVPIFNRAGALTNKAGFTQGILYAPPTDLMIPEVPLEPTEAELRTALGHINELLHDFKFAENSDRAHAIGMLVQPFVREMIDGPTPLYRVEAAVEGSGKGLLVDVLLSPALGNRISRIVEAANDDAEWRKTITTELLTGNGALIIDNVRKLLASGVLAKALTDIVWNDRLLGSNRDVALPVRWVWAITANNPVLSAEMMRRAPRIRIDAKCEHPERRTGFKHPYLRKWATENRPLLIWSALVLVQHWKAKTVRNHRLICLALTRIGRESSAGFSRLLVLRDSLPR
jgi:phage/plasmid primase-like uncharacterized protein